MFLPHCLNVSVVNIEEKNAKAISLTDEFAKGEFHGGSLMEHIDSARKTPKPYYSISDCCLQVHVARRKLSSRYCWWLSMYLRESGVTEILDMYAGDKKGEAFFSISALQTGFVFHLWVRGNYKAAQQLS